MIFHERKLVDTFRCWFEARGFDLVRDSEDHADSLLSLLGPGPQPLRGMSGFPAQQQAQAQARNVTLASARLPNGKLGIGDSSHLGGDTGLKAMDGR